MKEEKDTLKNHTKNLTEGSPVRLLLLFSLPLMAGNIFQQLYTIVDTAIVGKAGSSWCSRLAELADAWRDSGFYAGVRNPDRTEIWRG